MRRAKRKEVGRTDSRFEVRHHRRKRRKSDAYHFRPLIEPLEPRRLLTSVSGQDPLPGSHDAQLTTGISAIFDTEINPATVSAQSFSVHAMQTGQLLESLSVSGDTVTLSPEDPFHPGELVQATLTTAIENRNGAPLVDPVVWQFRTTASGGTGRFNDSGQRLGDSSSVAVALGDLDGDGDLDAFVGNARWDGEPNRVWSNDGSGTFTDSGQSFGDSSSVAVALGDVDSDGDLDAFVGNLGANTVWLNDGGANFADSGQWLGNSRTQAVALGDVDGDGDLDAFLGNYDQPDEVWLNDGSGVFSESGQSLGSSESDAAALGDVDGDGDLDAFVGNGDFDDPGQPNKVLLNDGSGNFTDSGQRLGDSESRAVTLGDLDGDGDLDAFVGNGDFDNGDFDNSGEPNKVWLNDGSGNFTDSGQSLGNSISYAVALGDVDGDGDLDAFVGTCSAFGDRGTPNKVWLNDGSGDFTDSGQSLGGSASWAVALADLDGDGDLDAFVGASGESGAEPISNTVWLNADVPADLSAAMTNGQFLATPGQSVTYTITVTNHGPEGVIGAILTDDFPVDISDVSWTGIASAGASCTSSGTGDISDTISLPVGGTVVYTATGQLSPTASGTITNVATVAAPMGLDDIRPANNIAKDTDVVPIHDLNPQPGSHTAPDDTEVSASFDEDVNPGTVSAQTFTVHAMQTGQILETLSASGDTITLSPASPFYPGELVQATLTSSIENLGGESLADPFVWQFRAAASGGTGLFCDSGQSPGDFSTSVALGDVDGDGDLDAFVGKRGANNVWLNDGSGSFSDSGQSLGNSWTNGVALGDLDEDGDLDAFVGNGAFYSGYSTVWLNDGSGNFSDSGQFLGHSLCTAVALGDVDGDGDLDAFVANGVPRASKVWLNDGSGNFTDSGQSLGNSWSNAVSLGDVDGDGDLDAFVANASFPDGHNKVWLNDGGGNFTDSGQILAGFLGEVNEAVALGDVDGDGDLDAFVGNRDYEGGPNRVWLNDGGGNFTDSGQILGGSRSEAVALGDVDGDGDLDAFVGNSLRCVQDACWPAPNEVWLNDGSGSFSDSGQSLGGSFSLAVAVGDLDGDGDLDTFVGNGGANTVWLNQDPLPGDFNNDMDIDGDDFLIWQAGFGIQMGATRADGDADRDGDVDGADLLIWQSNFESGSNGGAAGFAASVQAEQRQSAVDDVITRLRRPVTSMALRPLVDEVREDRLALTPVDGSDATWIRERTMESPRRTEAADRSPVWKHRTETDIAFESLPDKPLRKLVGPLHL